VMDAIWNRFGFVLLSVLYHGFLPSGMRIPLIHLPSKDCAPNKTESRIASLPCI